VETLDVPEIVAPSERLLAAIRYNGIVEVEYKFDARNGRYKLLDINPRLWTWSPLGGRAGMDFPYLLWKMMQRMPLARQTLPQARAMGSHEYGCSGRASGNASRPLEFALVPAVFARAVAICAGQRG